MTNYLFLNSDRETGYSILKEQKPQGINEKMYLCKTIH